MTTTTATLALMLCAGAQRAIAETPTASAPSSAAASAPTSAPASASAPASPSASASTTASASAAAASPAPAPAPSTIAITVRARGFRDANGQAVVALYRSSDTWLKIDRAFRRTAAPIRSGAVDVRFDALPPGEYAVAVVHDTNGNGKLDMRWFPWPKPREGAGVSNGATGGPPKWRDAKLTLRTDSVVDVNLIY